MTLGCTYPHTASANALDSSLLPLNFCKVPGQPITQMDGLKLIRLHEASEQRKILLRVQRLHKSNGNLTVKCC